MGWGKMRRHRIGVGMRGEKETADLPGEVMGLRGDAVVVAIHSWVPRLMFRHREPGGIGQHTKLEGHGKG